MIFTYGIGKLIFLIFAFFCAYQDFRIKSIDGRSCIYMCAFICSAYLYMLALGLRFSGWELGGGILLGIGIYILARVSGGIGEGDGLFFITCGLMMGFKYVLVLFCMSVFFISIFSLVLVSVYSLRGRKVKGIRIAMLPFVFLASIFLCILGG